MVTTFAGTSLRTYLDRIPLWRGNHVSIKQLAEDFTRYPYLPRLTETRVLIEAIRDGLGLLTWSKDTFAYADNFDEGSSRFRGLRCGQVINISHSNLNGILVKPDVAQIQQEADAPKTQTSSGTTVFGPAETVQPQTTSAVGENKTPSKQPPDKPHPAKRFHASVTLDPARVGRDARGSPTR